MHTSAQTVHVATRCIVSSPSTPTQKQTSTLYTHTPTHPPHIPARLVLHVHTPDTPVQHQPRKGRSQIDSDPIGVCQRAETGTIAPLHSHIVGATPGQRQATPTGQRQATPTGLRCQADRNKGLHVGAPRAGPHGPQVLSYIRVGVKEVAPMGAQGGVVCGVVQVLDAWSGGGRAIVG